MSPTYSEYLRLEELLKLQTGIEGETREISNDELHFILVHQNFELWFKLVINELKCTRDILASDYVEETKLPQAVHHMDRVIEIFKLMSQQWRVMETLEPQDFFQKVVKKNIPLLSKVLRQSLSLVLVAIPHQIPCYQRSKGGFWI